MTGRRGKQRNSNVPVSEFVTVAFAEDMDLAKQYKELLTDSDIPATIKEQPDSTSTFPGIAVMVPEDQLDEAHMLIESQGSYNDFYEMAFQDDDPQDLDLDFDAFSDSPFDDEI